MRRSVQAEGFGEIGVKPDARTQAIDVLIVNKRALRTWSTLMLICSADMQRCLSEILSFSLMFLKQVDSPNLCTTYISKGTNWFGGDLASQL